MRTWCIHVAYHLDATVMQFTCQHGNMCTGVLGDPRKTGLSGKNGGTSATNRSALRRYGQRTIRGLPASRIGAEKSATNAFAA